MHVKVHGLGANLKQKAMGISRGTENPPLNLHSYGLGLVWGGWISFYFGVTEQIANPTPNV